MQTFTKRQIRNLVIAVIVFNLLIIAEAQLLIAVRLEQDLTASSGLTLWTVVAIIYTLLLMVWIWNQPARALKRLNAKPASASPSHRRISVTTGILLSQCFLLISPNILGILLLFFGLPNLTFYFFPGISLAAGIAWSIFNLRTAKLAAH